MGNILLRRKLGLDEEKFLAAREELVDAGLVAPEQGKGGSTRASSRECLEAVNNLPIESLVEPYSREGKRAFKSRIQEEPDENKVLENRFWQLIYELHPKLITTERDPVVQVRSQKFQPDLFAVFDNAFLVADCKNTFTRHLCFGLAR